MASAYRARVKDDIAALVENFSTLVQSARISDDNIGQARTFNYHCPPPPPHPPPLGLKYRSFSGCISLGTDSTVNSYHETELTFTHNRVYLQDKRAPSDFPEVLAQKVVYAGQSLLALIGEIKRNAIVSDFKARNRDVTNLRARYAAAEAASEAEFLDLQARIHAVREVRSVTYRDTDYFISSLCLSHSIPRPFEPMRPLIRRQSKQHFIAKGAIHPMRRRM